MPNNPERPSVELHPGVLFDPGANERLRKRPYVEEIRERTEGLRFWDYLAYNEAGELEIDGVPVMALIERYGTPLEIVDTTIIERRTAEWKALVSEVAERVGYEGDFEYFYAAKANMSAEIALTAYRAGWMAETSGAQDLHNIYWLHRRGLIDADELKIICNGFKLPPHRYSQREERPADRPIPGLAIIDNLSELDETEELNYADYISFLRELGFDITPILDRDEPTYFARQDKPMDVGLRLKFGKVHTDEQLAQLMSRHGFSWEELQAEAEKIEHVPNLTLTTFHAMVGAAETIAIDTFVESLLFALDKYFQLRQEHPSLTHFNMGGGMPPMASDYNHEQFLEQLMTGAKTLAESYGQPLPTLMFEFGSFVASESGFHTFKIVQEKQNSEDLKWAVIDGGLMAAIPDMLVIDRSDFVVLAVNNANEPGKLVRLGDLSCDSDGIFPPKSAGAAEIMIPDSVEPTYLIILGVGAYQEILAGTRGAHHCGIPEAAEAIIVSQPNGDNTAKKTVYVMKRQTIPEVSKLLGYDDADAAKLQMIGID